MKVAAAAIVFLLTAATVFAEAWQINGFGEIRVGGRTHNDPPFGDDKPLAETRVQLDMDHYIEKLDGDLKFKIDFVYDDVRGHALTDTREAYISFRAGERLDGKVGRQVITWGTGDLLFINDLFPKDWVSFFAGRDQEYLKAPSDALKVSVFGNTNIDIVFTPNFDSDRFIDGERFGYWMDGFGIIGDDGAVIDRERRHGEEIALRLHRNIGAKELAFYAYNGYWKTPEGMSATTGLAIHPALSVFGASIRRPMGKGIGNVELGYYASRDDRHGDLANIRNSEWRLLLGYEFEAARDTTLAFQTYFEHMDDYDAYKAALPAGATRKDHTRTVFTTRLTRLLHQQTKTLSLFFYYSPSDRDWYIRPSFSHKLNDQLQISVGGNIFVGQKESTFFGQFEASSNVYVAIRRSF